MWRTGEGVGVSFTWDGLGDGGIRSTLGNGFNKETSERFQLGTPGQCERTIRYFDDTHAARSTQSCVEVKQKQF